MRFEVLRNDPLRALIRLEFAIAAIAYVLDISYTLLKLVPGHHDSIGEIVTYTLVYAIALATVSVVPHQPNRRYVAVVVAVLALTALDRLPQTALAGAVLFAILAARLTFAFGYRGTVVVWLVASAGVAAHATWEVLMHQPGATIAHAYMDITANLVFNTIIFGLIAIVWLYAERSVAIAASAERSQIALDLHDSLGHTLTALAVQLQNAVRLRSIESEKADAYVARAAATTAHVLADVRATVALLKDETTGQSTPLPLLLGKLRDEFEATHDFAIVWEAKLQTEPTGRTAMTIYRVLQEALTNVARHACATHVDVRIVADDGRVLVSVRDDGKGFDVDFAASGHGLASMRSRVESAGGTMMISSSAGGGTHMTAHVPFEASA